MLTFSFLEIFYLFGAFHGIFLFILLLSRTKNISTNIYLALLLLLFSFYLTENIIYSSGYLREIPYLFLASLPLIYLIGPLFYLYIRRNIQSNFKLRIVDAFHLAPFLIEVIILIPFYALDRTIKLKIYEFSLTNASTFEFNIFFFGYLIYILSTFWYFFQSFRLLSKVQLKGSSKLKNKHRWLNRISILFFGYILISLLLSLVPVFEPKSARYIFHVNLLAQTLLVHCIGYIGFLFPELFNSDAGKKYQFSALTPGVMSDLKTKLKQLLELKEPYVDPEISPEYFADALQVSKHDLSQILNEGLQTNFYDFVNNHRVEKAKKLLLDPEYGEAKVLHIAYDCGFSNKSSFLRNFKKHTGLTPTEYRANHLPALSVDKNRVPLP